MTFNNEYVPPLEQETSEFFEEHIRLLAEPAGPPPAFSS